jgi:hypothetical protein
MASPTIESVNGVSRSSNIGSITVISGSIIITSVSIATTSYVGNVTTFETKKGNILFTPDLIYSNIKINNNILSGLIGIISYYASYISTSPGSYVINNILPPVFNTLGTTNINPGLITNESLISLSSTEVLTYPSNRELIFGVITADKDLTLTIYNKRTDPITLISHDIPVNFGCILSGIDIGQVIAPLGQATLKITAKLLSGDSDVADFLPIYFDKVTIYIYLAITRQPIVIYSIYPDRHSYSESYAYKTNIFTSTSGKERRIAIMDTSKVNINYSITTNTASLSSFVENTIYSGLYDKMYQPLWAFATKSTATLSSVNIIPCDTYNGVFHIGDYCVIYNTEQAAILLKITNVTATSITVLKPISCKLGDWIIPVRLMIPSKSSASSYESSMGQKHNISLLEYS